MVPEPGLMAAIASPRRREILRMTWDEECGAGDIRRAMPDVSWGAVSLQLRALTDAKELKPTDPRVRAYLADAHARAGNRSASKAEREAVKGTVTSGELTLTERKGLLD